MKTLLFSFLLIAITGCASFKKFVAYTPPIEEQARLKCVNEGVDCTERERKALAEKRVFVGMPAEKVIMSWGKPSEIDSHVSKYGKTEWWIYRVGYGANRETIAMVRMSDGKVESISQ